MVLSVSNLIGIVLEMKRAGRDAAVGGKARGGLSIDTCFLPTVHVLIVPGSLSKHHAAF